MKQMIEIKFPYLTKILKIIKYNTINKIYQKRKQKKLRVIGKESLEQFKNAMIELDKKWFLVYGTLLGAYRDKDFIGHDVDIDIGMFFEDYSIEIEKTLKRYGFKKKHQFEVDNGKFALEETYEYKGLNIDIFYFKIDNDKLIGYDFINAPNMSWDMTIKKYGGVLVRELIFPYEGLDTIEFLGDLYLIPKNPENHLKSHYGNFWLKDKKWQPEKAKNFTILKNKIGIMKYAK